MGQVEGVKPHFWTPFLDQTKIIFMHIYTTYRDFCLKTGTLRCYTLSINRTPLYLSYFLHLTPFSQLLTPNFPHAGFPSLALP